MNLNTDTKNTWRFSEKTIYEMDRFKKMNSIDFKIKAECVRRYKAGEKPKQIYDDYFSKVHFTMSHETFRHRLKEWARKNYADNETLDAGTFDGFTAHGSTVQVDSNGNLRQAWIKQTKDAIDWESLIDKFADKVEPVEIETQQIESDSMLEIPLFDMHFGVAKFSDYEKAMIDINGIISGKRWDEINIIIGQDLLHNNDLRGHTAKGTPIEKVDIEKAWQDAWRFWNIIIERCVKMSNAVHVRYSKGNHDECISWCFVKALQAKFSQVHFDDSLKPRKIIYWKGCFIGYGHVEYTNKKNDIFRDFVIDYPAEFSKAKTREIHTGHLHRESIDTGVMVRRLASAVPVDDWSNNNGYASAHKRFQLFEFSPDHLKAIHYV